MSTDLERTTPQLDGHGEWTLRWKCPSCSTIQSDSVHPDAGPWGSCICEACTRDFQDEDLDPVSLANWKAARDAADPQEEP